jgi:hypothetical protein
MFFANFSGDFRHAGNDAESAVILDNKNPVSNLVKSIHRYRPVIAYIIPVFLLSIDPVHHLYLSSSSSTPSSTPSSSFDPSSLQDVFCIRALVRSTGERDKEVRTPTVDILRFRLFSPDAPQHQ